jgi:rhamnosyltransferase subunit B
VAESEANSGAVEPKRILLATIGSLGDLHPMLALGLELRRRGHAVTVASTSYYRDTVEALGVDFQQLRPNWDPTDRDLIAQCEDLKSGPEVLFRRLVLPHLREMYADLLAAAKADGGADVLIAGDLVFAAPLVAEMLSLRWASAILSPTSFFSAYDPSLLVNLPGVYRLRNAGWAVNRAILSLGKLTARHWWAPVRDLRRELGLRTGSDPLFRDKFSSRLVLALFSSALAKPQRDWPPQTLQPGFVFLENGFDKRSDWRSPELIDFLARGKAPVVFTLGSTAVHNPGKFYEVSLAAARRVGKRAILLGAKEKLEAPDGIALPYAPYAEVFPHAVAIVHQGGSGTCGQALRAGKPQLIVPYGWDQPDNGARVARLGAGLSLERIRYTEESAAAALERLLIEPDFAVNASAAAAKIESEDALRTACDAIEAVVG